MSRREINEEQLFNEALNEFAKYSFDEASINRIIANAGIAKGSFYYRFSNKYELYLYLLKEANKKKWEFIKAETRNEKESIGSDIFALFLKQAESGMRYAMAHPKFHKLSKMFSAEKGSAIYKQVLHDLKMDEESGLSQIIEGSYKSGNFKDEYSLEFIDKLVTSLFYSFDDILFKNEEYELEKAMSFLKEFINFLKYGLKNENQDTQ